MKKRVIATLLATFMVLGMTGCGNEKEGEISKKTDDKTEVSSQDQSEESEIVEEKEPVTIAYYYRNGTGEQQYTKQVEEILNDMLKEMEGYEHISIELHPTADMATEFTLAQASGAQIDLVATYGLDFNTHVSNGDFIVLDDLMAQYPAVVSELPDWMVGFGLVNGGQYYIPAYQQACTRNFTVFPDEYLAMYYTVTGKTEDDVRAVLLSDDVEARLDFYEEYLLAVREGTGKETKWLPTFTGMDQFSFNAGQLVSLSTSLFEIEGKDPVYWQATETYKILTKRMSEWYEKGYIHPDFATADMNIYSKNNMLNDESVVCSTYRTAASEELVAETVAPEIDCTAIWHSDHDFIISKYAAGGNAIYTDCEHPEEAMMIIELLMTEKGKEFYNTFVWGIEGTHWEWEDEANERIKTLEFDGSQGGSTSTYHAWKWNVGNTFNAWKNQAVTDDYNNMILSMHNSSDTVSSDCIGITWDLSSVSDQISQCNAVDKEYSAENLIMAGNDFEKVYNEYMEKLETAGVQDIIDVVLEQYFDYTGK